IRLNHPLKFSGYTLYQAGYQLNEFSDMTFRIHETDDADKKALDTFTIDLTSPEDEYELDNGFRVVLEEHYPDYYLDDNGEPRSETKFPRNPAFVFKVFPPDSDKDEVSFIEIGENLDATRDNQYKVRRDADCTHAAGGVGVRRDVRLPSVGLGAAVVMVVVIQGLYWHHRRRWIHPKGEGILLEAHTNKDYFGVRKDIEK